MIHSLKQIDWPFLKESLLFVIHLTFHFLFRIVFALHFHIGNLVLSFLLFCILNYSFFGFLLHQCYGYLCSLNLPLSYFLDSICLHYFRLFLLCVFVGILTMGLGQHFLISSARNFCYLQFLIIMSLSLLSFYQIDSLFVYTQQSLLNLFGYAHRDSKNNYFGYL
jgi:hypothetical protein